MKQQDLIRVLQAPVVSEKSTMLGDQEGKYVFKVQKKATKKDIKQAVETMFNVQVDSVNVLNVKGKAKRFGRFMGARSDWKKAYIKLKSGYKIELVSA